MTPELYCELCLYAVPAMLVLGAISFAREKKAHDWLEICDLYRRAEEGWRDNYFKLKKVHKAYKKAAEANKPKHGWYGLN